MKIGDLVKMDPLWAASIPEKDSVGIIVSIAYIDTARTPRQVSTRSPRYNIKWLNCQNIMCDYHKHHLIRLSGPVE